MRDGALPCNAKVKRDHQQVTRRKAYAAPTFFRVFSLLYFESRLNRAYASDLHGGWRCGGSLWFAVVHRQSLSRVRVQGRPFSARRFALSRPPRRKSGPIEHVALVSTCARGAQGRAGVGRVRLGLVGCARDFGGADLGPAQGPAGPPPLHQVHLSDPTSFVTRTMNSTRGLRGNRSAPHSVACLPERKADQPTTRGTTYFGQYARRAERMEPARS